MAVLTGPKFKHSRRFAYASFAAMLVGFGHALWNGGAVNGLEMYVTGFTAVVLGWMGVANWREAKDKQTSLEYGAEEEADDV